MKISHITVIALYVAMPSFAQVGIGTSNPQGDLDIIARTTLTGTEYNGITIPKVAILPSTTPPSGTILYLENTIAPVDNGFYFSDGTAFQNVTDILRASGNSTFYNNGTTNPSTTTTASAQREGNVSIGGSLNTGKLNLQIESTDLVATRIGLRVDNANSSVSTTEDTYGIFTINNSSPAAGTSIKYGIRNDVLSSGGSNRIGIQNNVFDSSVTAASSVTGIANEVGATNGTSSLNYAIRSEIGTTASTGINYGIHSIARNNGAQPTYSGWFQGQRFAIRNQDASDGYNMPVNSGTAGQVLTTDGTANGNATWTTLTGDDNNDEGILSVAAGGINDANILSTNGTNSTDITIAGGDGITVSESGNTVTVTKSQNFGIRAGFTTDSQVTNSTTGADRDVIRWFRVNYNNELTATTEYAGGTFTVSSEGYYHISAHIQSTFGSAGFEDYYGLAIYKNGIRTQATQSRNSPFEDFIRRSVNGLHYLVPSDTIEIYIGFPETFGTFTNIESDYSELIIKKLD